MRPVATKGMAAFKNALEQVGRNGMVCLCFKSFLQTCLRCIWKTRLFLFNSFQLVHNGACLLYQGHSNEVMCDD